MMLNCESVVKDLVTSGGEVADYNQHKKFGGMFQEFCLIVRTFFIQKTCFSLLIGNNLLRHRGFSSGFLAEWTTC